MNLFKPGLIKTLKMIIKWNALFCLMLILSAPNIGLAQSSVNRDLAPMSSGGGTVGNGMITDDQQDSGADTKDAAGKLKDLKNKKKKKLKKKFSKAHPAQKAQNPQANEGLENSETR